MATSPVIPPAEEHTQSHPNGSPTQHPTAGTAGITHEELERKLSEARDAVRREEKAKLYPDMERLRREKSDLETRMNDLQTALEEARRGSQEAVDLKKQIAQLQKKVESTAEQFSKAIDDALDRQNAEFEKTRQKDHLEAMRQKLIDDAKGEVIPELVTGDTPEELKASFERSQKRYREIAGKAAGQVQEEADKKLKDALPSPVVPGGTAGTGTGDFEGGIQSWRKMSDSDWVKKREAIKAESFRSVGLPPKQR